MTKEINAETQANIFLFDLKNEAKEHGFKADETWQLRMVTEEDMRELQRAFHPAVVSKFRPEMLLSVFRLTKMNLKQSPNSDAHAAGRAETMENGAEYLIAYSAGRFRH